MKTSVKNKIVEGTTKSSLHNTLENSPSYLNAPSLKKFIEQYKSSDKFNLLSLSGGKWLIPECQKRYFFTVLAKAIYNDEKNLNYIEYPLKGSNKVIIDVDIEQKTSKRIYTKTTIEKLLTLYHNEITKYSNKTINFIISEKDKPTKKDNTYKDGFHAIIPDIRLSVKILKEIRSNVIESLNGLFDNPKIINSKENIIDEAIISSNGWLPIGCYKPTRKPYQITFLFSDKKLSLFNMNSITDYSGFLYQMSLWTGELEENEEIDEEVYETQNVTYTKEHIIDKKEHIIKSFLLHPLLHPPEYYIVFFFINNILIFLSINN